MKAFLQLILPSLIVPVILSFSVFKLRKRYPDIIEGLAIIWLPSYLWMNGWPDFYSVEANNWLWLVTVVSVGLLIIPGKPSRQGMAQSVFLAFSLAAMIWPVSHLLDIGLAMELLVALLVGAIIFLVPDSRRSKLPALGLAISAGGFGIIGSLGGSLLLGQLAIALAAILSMFALQELFQREVKQVLEPRVLWPVVQLYIILVMIALVYADLAEGPVVLLLIAPLPGFILPRRYGAITSTVCVTAALLWLLLTTDSSSYY